jgi:integrase
MLVFGRLYAYIGHALAMANSATLAETKGRTKVARKIKNTLIDTRTARSKLKPRGKPYYSQILPGLAVGYRKPKTGSGKWVRRRYITNQTYVMEVVAVADDYSDADGVAVLSYHQVVEQERERFVKDAHAAAGKGPYTVRSAVDDYLDAFESRGKNPADARGRANSMILPVRIRLKKGPCVLGDIELADVTADDLREWVKVSVKLPARTRTAKGDPQQYRKAKDDPLEALRQRRSSVKRLFNCLVAAFNHAFANGKVESNKPWHRLQLFKGVDAARVRYLTIAEVKRLLNTCDPDFRNLIEVALLTGGRYGELGRFRVSDFNGDIGTLFVRHSKPGKSRHIILTKEGVDLLKQLCAGRAGDEILLRKADGTPWGMSHQLKRMREACARAGIKPAISFHGLRHTWASLSIMNGCPLMVVSKNLGHSDTRMVEHHYGHLAPSYVADEIRKSVPTFGIEPDNKVRALG